MRNENVWTLLGMLFVMAAILALAWGTTRLVGSRGVPGLSGGGRDPRLQILGQWSIGRSERLVLVQVGERNLLLGVTPNSVALLLELEPEEARQWQEARQRPAGGTPGFFEVLQKNLRGKK